MVILGAIALPALNVWVRASGRLFAVFVFTSRYAKAGGEHHNEATDETTKR
jgi:hypothetical protein